ncbi:hypothetical protein KHA80_03345 [Anaerobacillus sp. HL2]|nr:hypothetical protein KHA80_03345 [Anaerobacillus sp. HL2]
MDNTLLVMKMPLKRPLVFAFILSLIIKVVIIVRPLILNSYSRHLKKYSDLFWDDYEKGLISPQEYRRKYFCKNSKQYLSFNEKDADHFHEHYYNIVDDFSVPYPNLHKFIHTLIDAK